MEIERFEAIGKCLFWREKNILIVGDLHLGYEEMLKEQGYDFSVKQLEQTLSDLRKIFAVSGKVAEIILLGDVKHNFGSVLKMEFGDFYKVVGLIRENLLKNGKIIVLKGNHDVILESIVKNYGDVSLKESFIVEDVMFMHGSAKDFEKNKLELFDKNIKLIVIGHFHPAVEVIEDVKKEKYKCFLYGKERKLKKEMIVVPSFFPLVEGVAVNEKVLENSFDVSNYSVFAIDSENNIYDLGLVKKLKS